MKNKPYANGLVVGKGRTPPEMGSKHQIPAVVTSLNVNGLAVARTLGRHGVPVIAIHNNDTDPETRSRFVSQRWHSNSSQLIETLLKHGPEFSAKPVLLAITDDAVTAIAHNLESLREFYTVPMPRAELVLQLLDKRGFDQIAKDHNLPLPQTWYVHSPEELAALREQLSFPCVLKPQEKTPEYFGAGGLRAYILDDFEALQTAYRTFADVEPRVVIQQFIPGGDDAIHFCLQACANDHSAILPFAGRKLRQWHPHCGGTSLCEPIQNEALVRLTSDFFKRIGMLGPCSMEFKRDPRDGTYYVIEPTVCRTDWQNAVADANDTPVIYAAYCAALGLPPPQPANRPGRRRWVSFGSDRMSASYYIQRGELSRPEWLWSIRPPIRGAYFALDDWGPYLAICTSTLRRGFAKLSNLFKPRSSKSTPA